MTEAELALERAKKLAFLMTERFSMNPISAKLLNEAWRLAFPDEVAVARRMRALVEALEKALEKAQQRIFELESKLANPVQLPKTNGYWTETEKAYEEAITLAKRQIRLAGFRCEGDE